VPIDYENSIGMKFVLIPPGEFMMGSTAEEIEATLAIGGTDNLKEYISGEAPRHKVILSQSVYLAINEVTQAQYEQVMGLNPSSFAASGGGKDSVAGLDTTGHPVETVSWNDAAEFCAKLSEREKLKPVYSRTGDTVTILSTGGGYRLPTEAEWEFACRAGTTTRFSSGDQDESLFQVAWIGSNSHGVSHPVGELQANQFGLYDIHGNVWEWVQDWWGPTYYSHFQGEPAIDPGGPASAGSQRVIRGGSWYNQISNCRASRRNVFEPTNGRGSIGFRLALSPSAITPEAD
jgi:formylglycine-generating enzyme required for sulfatase activity